MLEVGSMNNSEVDDRVVKYMVKFNSEHELNKALGLKKDIR